jgi:hypothetical protein
MDRCPILPQKGSRLVIEMESDDRLRVRTKPVLWWPAYPVLLLIILWGSGCFASAILWLSPNEAKEIAHPPWFVSIVACLPVLAIFLFLLGTQRLLVEDGLLACEWHWGPLVPLRKCTTVAAITRLECFVAESFDYLEIHAEPWIIQFSAKRSYDTLEEIRRRIEELRQESLTPEQRAQEAKAPPPPVEVRRKRDRRPTA